MCYCTVRNLLEEKIFTKISQITKPATVLYVIVTLVEKLIEFMKLSLGENVWSVVSMLLAIY